MVNKLWPFRVNVKDVDSGCFICVSCGQVDDFEQPRLCLTCPSVNSYIGLTVALSTGVAELVYGEG